MSGQMWHPCLAQWFEGTGRALQSFRNPGQHRGFAIFNRQLVSNIILSININGRQNKREDGESTHSSLPLWPGSDYISCVHNLLIRTKEGGKCSFWLDSHFSVGTSYCERGTGVLVVSQFVFATAANWLCDFHEFSYQYIIIFDMPVIFTF